MAAFIHENFIPVASHIKERPVNFHRFDAAWTPTVLVMDPDGKERWRIEGYLTKQHFRAQLEMGLARTAFMRKQWADAERRYGRVVERYGDTAAAPEAVYWRGVSRYKTTSDHTALGEVAKELRSRYPQSVWAEKASVWAPRCRPSAAAGQCQISGPSSGRRWRCTPW